MGNRFSPAAHLASVEHEMLVVMDGRSRPGGGNLEAPFTWLTSLLFCPCLVVNFNNRAKVKKKTQQFFNTCFTQCMVIYCQGQDC